MCPFTYYKFKYSTCKIYKYIDRNRAFTWRANVCVVQSNASPVKAQRAQYSVGRRGGAHGERYGDRTGVGKHRRVAHIAVAGALGAVYNKYMLNIR